MKKQTQLFEDQITIADVPAADTYSKRIKVAAKWCLERHKIYISKETRGLPKPWTDDWILRGSRFTNVYREIDRGTTELMDCWVLPQVDSPNIGILSIMGRVINWAPTLSLMVDAGFTFERKPNSERMFSLFQKIRERKEKLVTGAYIVNTVFPRDFPKLDGSKADYIANFLAPELWSKRHVVQEGLLTGSFHETIQAMRQVHGVGAFIGNQAAVDLTYTPVLSKAKDIDSTWNPGPGTTKGIRWITGDKTLRGGTAAMDLALAKYREDLNHELGLISHKLWSSDVGKMRTRVVPVSGPNCSNTLCELSKYTAMALGTRDRLKNNYNGK
jgi:hypothetical protein